MTGTNEFDLSFLANLSAIGAFVVTLFGAAVGIHGYWKFRSGWKAKTRELESYLKRKRDEAAPDKKGQHTITHLVRHLGLTEDEILKISFESAHVDRKSGTDAAGRADVLFFVYKD